LHWLNNERKQTESKCNYKHQKKKKENIENRKKIYNHIVADDDDGPFDNIDEISSATTTVRPDSCDDDDGK